MDEKIQELGEIFTEIVKNYSTMGMAWKNIPLCRRAYEIMRELPDELPGEYDTPADKAILLCQMLDHVNETDIPRYCIEVRRYIQSLDPDNEDNNEELDILLKYIESDDTEHLKLGMLKSDSVERSPQWEDVIYAVELEVDEILKDYTRGMGFCHAYWHTKREVLAKYGIDWKTPSMMNPGVMFD